MADTQHHTMVAFGDAQWGGTVGILQITCSFATSFVNKIFKMLTISDGQAWGFLRDSAWKAHFQLSLAHRSGDFEVSCYTEGR